MEGGDKSQRNETKEAISVVDHSEMNMLRSTNDRLTQTMMGIQNEKNQYQTEILDLQNQIRK